MMTEARKKRMLDWLKKHPQKNKGRRKTPAMTKSFGRIIYASKK